MGEGEGEELNCRQWANIAVLRDEGEPRCRVEGLVMLADETHRGMEGYTCGRDD